MVKYCAVFGCNSSSASGLSMFAFPKDKNLRKIWSIRTKRKNFTATDNSCICCKHFVSERDYIQHPKKKQLKAGAVPSIFAWTKLPALRRHIERRDVGLNDSSTDTASETESSMGNAVEVSTQTSYSTFCLKFLEHHQDKSLLKFYTGFKDFDSFQNVLRVILPDKNRANMVYYHGRRKSESVEGKIIFDSDYTSEDDIPAQSSSLNLGRNCKLSVEDEFLMVLMKLRVGLFYKDLATRFEISCASVQRIFFSWIQLMYLRLGSLKCFPHSDVIVAAMKPDFKQEYPSTMIIIDCTELKLETPSSLLRQSQTFSNYKSTNTLKCLLGVDSRGGIMFVSHLFTGSISDKEICQRSGFLNLLKWKMSNGELHAGDSVMADKGFNIVDELQQIGLVLNVPPFLCKRSQLSGSEVIETQTIARHRIHVERAIRKVRQFHFFDRKVPVSMLHMINQIWLVCCMLNNFQDPIVS